MAVLVSIVGLFGTATALASRVGGQPTWPPLGPAPKHGKAPVVLGVGGRPRVELIAYDSVQGLCVYADEVRVFSYFDAECNAGFGPPREGPIFISSEGSGDLGRSRHRYSTITGLLTPAVVSVRVHFRYAGRERSRSAVVGQVRGSLLARLRMSRPFCLFALAVNHCVTSELTVVAFDRDGGELGSVSTSGGPLPFGPPCALPARPPR